MNKEFDLRPTFDLATHLAMFNRGAQPSKADGTMNTIAAADPPHLQAGAASGPAKPVPRRRPGRFTRVRRTRT
jgi:hypothetical protein